jgi:predicted RNA-binding Zn ribbon-like protein
MNSSADAGERGSGTRSQWLALELAGTIRHDGDGGVADGLEDSGGLASWVRARRDRLEPEFDTARFSADDRALGAVVAVRTAVRALLARAVAPAAPSRADAGRLPSATDALEHLNRIGARVPVAFGLDWPTGHAPGLRFRGAAVDPVDHLTSILAREAMLFLTDADSERLAACSAPRCVRYFLKEHGRQEYCKPSCSNRARAARHYQRHREPAEASTEAADTGKR